MATTAPQPNGIPASSAGTNSQTLPSQSTAATATTSQPQSQSQAHPPHPQSPTHAPRPRDARTLELLLTAQGVTSYESRVPLLLLDFAYRHTSSILSDALHLSADPYTTHAGSKASATQGAAASVPVADAQVSANAVQVAIASKLGYQFAAGGGGTSKEYLLEMAGGRNRTALPRVAATEWGVRLPSERFVLSGVGWGLREGWEGREEEGSGGEDEELGMGEAMEGVETEDVTGEGVEGGTAEDVFGEDLEDEDMAEE